VFGEMEEEGRGIGERRGYGVPGIDVCKLGRGV
jgi:hypothetical protein